jgi:hypothetical protein
MNIGDLVDLQNSKVVDVILDKYDILITVETDLAPQKRTFHLEPYGVVKAQTNY